MNPNDPNNSTQPAPVTPTQPPAETPVATSPSGPANEQSAAVPAPVVPQIPKSGGKKKLLVGGLIALVILVLLGAGFVFAFYLPNRPATVYNTSVDRSGEAFKEVINRATEKSRLERFTKSDLNLTIQAKAGGQTFDGSYTTQFDKDKSKGTLTLKSNTDDIDLNLSADFISEILAGKQFPNSYFRVNGLAPLVEAGVLPSTLAKYDKQWIGVDAAYFESMLGSYANTTEEQQQQQLSSEDITEMVRAATDATAEYVFTSNASKAVFTNQGFVKAETINNTKMNQYNVSLNTANATAYCKALAERVMGTSGYKKTPFAGGDQEAAKKDALKSCDDNAKDAGDKNTFTIWVDTGRKLIHKVRVTPKEKADQYVEFGQNYVGGSEVGFFVHYHSDTEQQDATFTLNSNIETGNASGTLQFEGKGDNPFSVTVKLEAKPFEGSIDVTPPAASTPLQEVLRQLGF